MLMNFVNLYVFNILKPNDKARVQRSTAKFIYISHHVAVFLILAHSQHNTPLR